MNKSVLDRFMEKVEKTADCWNWIGGLKGSGYGIFYLNGKYCGAHRVSLFLFKGQPLCTPLQAMHSCDNPRCVNPSHLKYGTAKDNMRDAANKGRIVRVQNWKGERNPKAKLTEADVRKILRGFCDGASYKVLATKFNVSPERIGQIVRAKKNGGGWDVEEF